LLLDFSSSNRKGPVTDRETEEYARDRISNSPLSLFLASLPSPLNNPPLLIEQVQKLVEISPRKSFNKAGGEPQNETMSVDTYEYIKDVIVGVILNAVMEDKSASLIDICDIINAELLLIQSMGLEYLLSKSEESKFWVEVSFEPYQG
jgi:hypothetical protein